MKIIKFNYIILISLNLVLALFQQANAEFILMKDGSILEGDVTLDLFNNAVVYFKFRDGAGKYVPGKDIEKIFQDNDFKVKRKISMKDGTVLEGYIVYEGWFRYFIRKDLAVHEEIEIAKSEIQSMDPPSIKNEMRQEIIAKKKEGWYVTGVPVIAYSTDNGFRGGVRAYLFYNGSRNDEYFSNTPYIFQTHAFFAASTGGLIEGRLNFDWRHVGGSLLRIKANVEYEQSKNANYFGVGSKSTDMFQDVNGVYYKTYLQYLDFLCKNNYQYYKYNKYEYQMPKFSIDFIGDWSFPLKPLLGYEFKWAEIKTWDGRAFLVNDNTVPNPASTTLLTRENPLGINGGITSYIRAGVAFDTRDFTPDPHEGFYIDYAFEGASYAFGSNYDFIRNTFGFRFYTSWFETLTLALRLGYVASFYDMPFYEMGIFGFLFERQAGLGGERTIRGYQQWRFIGKGMTLANLELRYRFIDIIIFNQRLSYKLVAFIDAGNAYDTPVQAFTKPRFEDYKLAYGFGGLLTWNQATVMRMYVGFSPEDINFAVNFAHVF